MATKAKIKSKVEAKAKTKAKAKPKPAAKTKLTLLRENKELRARQEEQEETLRAIRNGEVDALLVSTPKGEQVYTLKGAEQIYRVFIETMHEGALLLSSDGVILYANNRFSEMVGLTLEQLINSPLRKFIPASDRAVCKSLLAAGIRERCSDEITLRGAGRKAHNVRVSCTPFLLDDKPCVCAVVTDVSEIKQYLQIIEESRLAQAVVQQANDCIIVCDKQGTILQVSNIIRRYSSLCHASMKLEDVLPLQYSEFRTGRKQFFSPADALSGKSIVNENVTFTKDSQETFHFILNAQPLRDKQDKIIGCLVILTDITAQMQAELKLHDSEKRLATFFQASPAGIFITRLSDGLFIDVNEEYLRIIGYPAEEVIGSTSLALHIWPNPEVRDRIIKMVGKQGRVDGIEIQLRQNSGELIDLLASMLPLEIKGEKCVLGVLTDITERKKAEKLLHRSEERFKLLSDTASQLIFSTDPQAIVNELCIKVMEHLDCHAFFNFMADDASGRLHLNACAGISKEEARKIEWLDYGVAVCGCVAAEGHRIVAEDIFCTPDPRTELVKSYGIQAYACHPMLSADRRVIGTLSFGTRTRNTFTTDDLDLMKTVADQVAVAMERKLSQIKLRESEANLKRAQEIARTGSWIYDLSGRLSWSEELYQIYGVSPETFTPNVESFINLIHPDDRPAMQEWIRACTAGEKPDELEFRAILPDGTVRFISGRGELIFDAEGSPTHMSGTAQDITGRKQAEQELARLASFPLLNPQPIVEVDLQGVVQFANPAARRIFPNIEQQHTEHALLMDFRSALDRCLETGANFINREIALDERWYLQNIHYVPENARVRIYNLDITERKLIADAQSFLLQCDYKGLDENFFESLARYLAEKLNMYYVCIDQLHGDCLTAKTLAIYCDGKFEDNVEYTLKDTPCGDVVGKPICTFPKDVCRLFPRDSVLQEMRAESYVGTTLWSSQGRPIGLIAVIGRQQLPNPGPTESILQLVAIRAAGELERRQAEEALRRAKDELELRIQQRTAELVKANKELQESKGQLSFLSSQLLAVQEEERKRISREVHDVITSSLGAILLSQKNTINKLDKEDTEAAKDAIGRAVVMTQDVMRESRRIINDLRPPMLDDLGLITTFSWLSRQFVSVYPHIVLNQEISAAEADVPEELKIVIFRIAQEALTNIGKYSQAQTAHLTLKKAKKHLELCITDNGIGFDVQNTLSKRGPEKGLGLISMRERAELSGGTLTIESAVGKGTTIHAIWKV